MTLVAALPLAKPFLRRSLAVPNPLLAMGSWNGECDKDWECGTLEPASRRILGSGLGQLWLGGLAGGSRGSSECCRALCHPEQQ